MEIVNSVNGVPIRLTEERWLHIVENHPEVAGYYYEILEAITNPDIVVKGYEDEYIALKRRERKKYLLVIYKEVATKQDGFVITAFFSSKVEKLLRREAIWKQKGQ